MSNIVIRNVREEDIEEIADINIDGWQTAYRGIISAEFLNNIDRKLKIEKIKGNYKENNFIVATLNNEVVGFCRYTDNNEFSNEYANIDCEVCALYVKSTLKRQGIGKTLIQFAIDDLKRKGKKQMILWCLKDNNPSRAFYEKMGGKIYKYKPLKIGEKEYEEISYIYDIENL